MSNLAKTQAQWNRHFEEEFCELLLAPIRLLRECKDRFRFERTQVVLLDGRGYVTSLTLAGVVTGVNTDTKGQLYIRIAADGGNWDINIYKATGAGGGDLVASVNALAAAGTSALTAENSSGLSGSITIGASMAAVANDTIVAQTFVDFRKLARDVLDGDGAKDSATLALLVDAYDQVWRNTEASLAIMRGAVQRWAAELGQSGPEFTGQSFASLVSDEPVRGNSGEVSRRRTGFLPFYAEAMEDEGTAGEQDVVRRVTAGGAGSFDAANTGQGAVASHTPGEQCPAGVWTFECDAGQGTGRGGSETFSGRVKISGTDEELTFSGLTIKQSWTGPRGFGPITLTRTHSKTNDGSNNNFAAASGAVVTGEKESNTNAGVLYVKITANGSNWDIAFYKASTQTDSEKVAEALNVATSAAFTAEAKNGSGLTIAWTMGGTPGASTNITFNLNFFVVQNGDGVPDKFTVTTSVTGTPGLIQETVSEELGYPLNSDTSGSETFADAHMKANTFPDYLVQDN